MPFLDSLDIANRALQHIGATKILSINEDSKNNNECSFAYDKIRAPELRRNVWTFATRRVVLRALSSTSLIIVPVQWSATTTYQPGAVVSDTNGILWMSMLPSNINNPPGSTTVWEEYFGPLTADAYDPTIKYFAGELIYVPIVASPGSFIVFRSLQSANAASPIVTSPWSTTTTYGLDDVVSYLGSQWRGLIPLNLNNVPVNPPANFDVTVTYSTAQHATGSDGFVYASVGNGNIGHDPTSDGGVYWANTNAPAAWTNVPALYPASQFWLPLYCGLTNLFISYPIGAGPSENATSKNAYYLPNGYLRLAPQNPKQGSTSFLGAPSAAPYNDWEFEGPFLITTDLPLIILRFVADVTSVTAMDDMFCEGLSCRVAMAVAEPLTQSTAKLGAVGSLYKMFMGEARLVNAIEEGATEPPEDDYISCRA